MDQLGTVSNKGIKPFFGDQLCFPSSNDESLPQIFYVITPSTVRFSVSALLALILFLTPLQMLKAEQTLTPVPCWFAEGDVIGAECHQLSVPMRHGDPVRGMINIAVVRFPSLAAAPRKDPLIFINGGPGQALFPPSPTLQNDPTTAPYQPLSSPLEREIQRENQREILEGWLSFLAPFRENRDVWLFDQRGAGQSKPSLDCPELERASRHWQGIALSRADILQREAAAVAACRDRLLATKIDFSAFNSWESADDIADLITAIGAGKVNLFAVSYGGRLAFEVMRRHGSLVRSVVLDSAFPPDARPIEAEAAILAFAAKTFFESCAQQKSCQTAFPNLEQKFLEVLDRLKRDPPVTRLANGIAVYLDHTALLSAFTQALAAKEILPHLPHMIDQAARGRFGFLASLAGNPTSGMPDISEGLYLTIECSEIYAWTDREKMEQWAKDHPNYAALAQQNPVFSHCPLWPLYPAASTLLQPVTSDVPVLLLSGRFDPITPASWSQHATQTLSKAVHIIFEEDGHDVTGGNDCALQTAANFLNTPSKAALPDCALSQSKMSFMAPLDREGFGMPLQDPGIHERDILE